MSTIRALIVLTSTDEMPEIDRETGYYIDEMAAPWAALKDAGAEITFASIKGGEPPVDPNSLAEDGDDPAPVKRVLADDAAQSALRTTPPIEEIDGSHYDVVYLPGGHGTMWDFRQSDALGRVVSAAWQNGAVVGAVCHGPAGLLEAVDAQGEAIVKGRTVSGFTNEEEAAVGLDGVVPYLLESALRDAGANVSKGEAFEAHALRDGRLVTGQNPASAERVGALLLEALHAGRAQAA